MNREERVRAALASKDVDRVPVATWMHLSQFDQGRSLWQKQKLS